MTQACCEGCQGDAAFTEDEAKLYPKLDSIIEARREQEGCLIPILQDAQELFGYLPDGAMKKIAYELEIPFGEVAGVVGFYSFFSTIPRGRYLVRVCLGTACYVRGGKEVLEALEKALEIGVGETTDDRMFSLDIGRCFGACGLAPVIMIDDETFQRVKPSTIESMLAPYRAGTI